MKKALFALLVVLGSCFALSAFGLQPIPVDKAFDLKITPVNDHTLSAQWKIAPGYHLYRDRISFNVPAETAQIGAIVMPEGIAKENNILGKYQIYQGDIKVTVPFTKANSSTKQLNLTVNYQGCADSGFCYPPVTKEVKVDLSNLAVSNNNSEATSQISTQDKITQLLVHQSWGLILLAFLGFGLLLAFTPCILPMIPILSGIIVGGGKNITTLKAFWLSFTYVLAMAITYAVAGVVAGLAGSYVQVFLQSPMVIAVFSGVFVLLALSLFGFYEIRMPNFLHSKVTELSNKQSGGNYFGVAVMGCLSTLIVSPCVSAPLIGALSYIGKTGNAALGGSALFAMGLGMGLPLLIIGTMGGKFLPKAGVWMDAVKNCFGVLMLGVAVLLLSRILAPQITMMLWAGLLIMSAVYMGAFTTVPDTGGAKLWKGVSVIFLVYGFLLLMGAGMGNSNPLEPLAMKQTISVANASQDQKSSGSFKIIKSYADLKTELAQAKAQGKPVILDFYADWCLSCKEMDRSTFQDPKIQAKLSQFVVLRADVTANDDIDKALEKNFNVIAPPSILFFTNGRELTTHRVVGEIGPEEFSEHLKNISG